MVHAGKYQKLTKSLPDFRQIELKYNNQIKMQVEDGKKRKTKVLISTIGAVFKRFSTAKTSIDTLVSNKTTALY